MLGFAIPFPFLSRSNCPPPMLPVWLPLYSPPTPALVDAPFLRSASGEWVLTSGASLPPGPPSLFPLLRIQPVHCALSLAPSADVSPYSRGFARSPVVHRTYWPFQYEAADFGLFGGARGPLPAPSPHVSLCTATYKLPTCVYSLLPAPSRSFIFAAVLGSFPRSQLSPSSLLVPPRSSGPFPRAGRGPPSPAIFAPRLCAILRVLSAGLVSNTLLSLGHAFAPLRAPLFLSTRCRPLSPSLSPSHSPVTAPPQMKNLAALTGFPLDQGSWCRLTSLRGYMPLRTQAVQLVYRHTHFWLCCTF
ncbi:hypothetical protein GOBAR_AA34000 [Gossypium barbadense]|uniref:Uncharacterized protein n=1 Tax=Gossypium barbadense TaxID=3634 RepID=A0A2P5W6I1_GOSBA|nr:hypothetical protein GOBAR_AA34000 [Gossypium barbadense]